MEVPVSEGCSGEQPVADTQGRYMAQNRPCAVSGLWHSASITGSRHPAWRRTTPYLLVDSGR